MAIVDIITANCENGKLSQGTIARRWDDKGTLIQFAGYPEPDDDEQLIYRLIVWMKTSEDADPSELPPIELEADQWLVSNVYTQLAQTIRFQLCITNESGTYEKHSPIFAGNIGKSLSHNGEEADIDVSELFDPYKKYVDELVVAAGAVVIDTDLDTAGAAADAKATGDALAGLNGRLDGLGDGVPTEVRQALLTLFQSAAYAETGLTDEIAVIASWAAVVTAISLNQSSISISGASTSQLVATTTPTGGAVSWASSDTSVATVSNSGLVTGVGNGTATITASCGGKRATCSVTVSGFASLTGITATYTQSGTVYDTDTLDSLKSDLVVVATYSDSTTRTLLASDYTLSGTLEVGTSTIVVSYGGKTDTFNVSVSKPLSFSKNFSDISWTPGYIDNNGEYVSDSSNAFCDEYIDAEYPSGFALVYNTAATNNSVTIYEFDSNGVFLGKETGTPYAYLSNAGTSKVKLGCTSSITSSTVDAFLKIEKTSESSAITIPNTNLGTAGEETTVTGKSCSDFISLDAYASPVYFMSSVNGGIVVCFYDENKAFISRSAKGNGWACNAIPSGAKYVRIACSVGEGYSQFSSFLI